MAFGTGDGRTLKSLINHFKPYHRVIALSDWQEFAPSFWEIDWLELSNAQKAISGGKLSLGVHKDFSAVLRLLAEDCHAGIDHSLVYVPPEGCCSSKARTMRKEIDSITLHNSVSYMGYTVDEHNMVWNSWKTLLYQPRIFRQPHSPLGGRMVVCGSGPSLDPNLQLLKELSRTHLITACGSNFRSLKANGIRVDFLALVERADEVLADVKAVVDEYGSGETRLLMSSTCHHQLQDLVCDTMIYFRPALTPLALFSNSPSEILSFEGPESINTGIGFAASLGLDELVLVGVDLGARSLQKVRSSDAVGCSTRKLDIEMEANFGGTVFSSSLLRDSCQSVEACLRCYQNMKVFNASDGVAIKGTVPQLLDERVQLYSKHQDLDDFASTQLGSWWNSSIRYTPERFLASWKSRRPRAEVSSLITSLDLLFRSKEPWSPVLISQVTKLLSLDVSPAVSFPRRVLRSTIHKLVIAINRQLMVMAVEPAKAAEWELRARKILVDLLQPLEQELYDLCDAVEALPTK